MAQRASELAAEGEEVFDETANGMERIATLVNSSADKVTALGASSAQIGEIIQVIEDIADQTNLLALNAAIEAARAGEHGKGFAVVADEVRQLAERTTSATQKIASMITQIQERTQEVVASMERGTDEVENGLDLAEEASAALSEIVSSIDGMVTMIDQIASASQQQSTATNQIAGNVESISAVADEVSQSTNNLAEMAVDMSQKAEDLSGLIERFTIDTGPVDVAPTPNGDGANVPQEAYARSNGAA
jgi:methyl-accepting chemotaxis protein